MLFRSKLPDADHLTEVDRKQLAYQLSRRAWRAAVPTLGVEGLLVAVLAEDDARAQARKVAP